jgi:hypothetical protein
MPSRELLLCAVANDVGLPMAFAKVLSTECAWLGTEEVNEGFRPDLLAEQCSQANVSHDQIERFFYAYNNAHQSVGDEMTSKHSVKRRSSSKLRLLPAAAHVKR